MQAGQEKTRPKPTGNNQYLMRRHYAINSMNVLADTIKLSFIN